MGDELAHPMVGSNLWMVTVHTTESRVTLGRILDDLIIGQMVSDLPAKRVSFLKEGRWT